MAEIVASAEALCGTLDEQLLSTVHHELDSPTRPNWSNLPAGIFRERNGIRMGDLNDEQRAAVSAFLKTSLSEEGFEKVNQIVRADGFLEQTSRQASRFGWPEDNYWFAFFGTPSTTEAWAWQFGGHHLAVNVTIHGDHVSMTPTFLGVEPATYEDAGEQIAPLKPHLEAGLALMTALSPAERASTLLSSHPGEVYAGAGRDGVLPPVEGARVSDWPAEHHERVLALARLWVGTLLPKAAAKPRMAEIAAQLPETRFAWNGPTDGSGSIYYRIQGPQLLIEFSTQGNLGDNAGHYHSIYRNPAREYGGVMPRAN